MSGTKEARFKRVLQTLTDRTPCSSYLPAVGCAMPLREMGSRVQHHTGRRDSSSWDTTHGSRVEVWRGMTSPNCHWHHQRALCNNLDRDGQRFNFQSLQGKIFFPCLPAAPRDSGTGSGHTDVVEIDHHRPSDPATGPVTKRSPVLHFRALFVLTLT